MCRSGDVVVGLCVCGGGGWGRRRWGGFYFRRAPEHFQQSVEPINQARRITDGKRNSFANAATLGGKIGCLAHKPNGLPTCFVYHTIM